MDANRDRLRGGVCAMRTKIEPSVSSASVHQLKITLDNIDPPIWRRVLVPSDLTLGQLHGVIQIAMGWEEAHMHQFEVGRKLYGERRVLDMLDMDDEDAVELRQVAPKKGSKLQYEYDMGDGWRHTLLVEAVTPADPKVKTPTCLEGVRACPPEDCGGVWGYVDLLDTLADPTSPEYEDMMDWIGPIDPEAFDLKAVNKQLTQRR
jgi:hypothetical protein